MITRFWTNSTEPDVDVVQNSMALNDIFRPAKGFVRTSDGPQPQVQQYFAENPPPHTSTLLQRMLQGARTPDSPTSFLETFITHFDLPGFNANHADASLRLLMSIYDSMFTEADMDALEATLQVMVTWSAGGDPAQQTEFLKAFRSMAQQLWTTLFTAAIKYFKSDHAHIKFTSPVIQFVVNALRHCFKSSQAELFDMIKSLLRAGLIQLLDVTVKVLLSAQSNGAYMFWSPLMATCLISYPS